MLNKCANPDCRESFRYLQKGRLFRVEEEPQPNSVEPKDPEYFWLCSECSKRMTLRLDETAGVITVTQSESVAWQGGAHFVLLERRHGTLLSLIHFSAKGEKPEAEKKALRKAAGAR